MGPSCCLGIGMIFFTKVVSKLPLVLGLETPFRPDHLCLKENCYYYYDDNYLDYWDKNYYVDYKRRCIHIMELWSEPCHLPHR